MNIFITVTGLQHHFGATELNANQKITLRKEPENKYDNEAIAVYLEGGAKIGYVANSTYTVGKGTYSAGRLFDKIEDEKEALINVVLSHQAIATVMIEK